MWDIANLGERLNGIQEVSGSIPLISTKTDHEAKALWSVFIKNEKENSDVWTGSCWYALTKAIGSFLFSFSN